MQKFSILFRRWLPVLVSVVCFVSCSVEKGGAVDPDSNENNEDFVLELPGETRSTIGSIAENRIGDITVLIFDKTTKALLTKIPGTTLVSSGTNNNTWSFKAEMPMGTYDLVALANASSYLTSITSGTKDEIAAALVVSANAKWNTSNNIPMWGELSNHTLTGSGTTTFKMMRMLAKINVSLAASVTKFKMSGIYYYNYNSRGYIVPHPDNYTEVGGNITITAPSTYSNAGKQDAYLTYTGTTEITGNGTACIDKIYVFEAAHVAAFPGPTGDYSQWKTNPCLIIAGSYDGGATSYYRVDFIEKTTGVEKWHSLLRNHAYGMVITGVNGPGYDSPATALGSAPMNMNTDTYVSNASNMSAVSVDGPYYMAVSESDLVVARSQAPKSLSLTLKTNHPDGWSAVRYTDAACTVPMTGSTTPSTSWLTVGTMSGGTTIGTNIQVNLTTNTVGIGYIKFTSGRMSLVVKVSCSIAPDFARSHIVQVEAGKLTFAVSQAENMLYPANSQGMQFRFGSLIGISTTGSNYTTFNNNRVTFIPSGGPSKTWTWTYSSSGGSGNDDTNNIPYCNQDNTQTSDYFALKYGTTRYSVAEGRGDICKYISDQGWVSEGTWRMPTRDEIMMLLWDETPVKNGEQAGIRYGGSAATSITQTYGKQEMTSGVFLGTRVNSGPLSSYDAKMPPEGVLFLPAGGYRSGPGPDSGSAYAPGAFLDPGNQATAWSTSTEPRKTTQEVHKTLRSYCMNSYGGGGIWKNGQYVRGDAMPVRCIRVN